MYDPDGMMPNKADGIQGKNAGLEQTDLHGSSNTSGANIVNIPPLTMEGGGYNGEDSTAVDTKIEKKVKFYRIDLASPVQISTHGFKGNNTPRVLKLFGDDTIFAAQDLEGIVAFKEEVKSPANVFGEFRKYYFENKIIDGYVRGVPRALYLYEIEIPEAHPHHILSEYFKKEGAIVLAHLF